MRFTPDGSLSLSHTHAHISLCVLSSELRYLEESYVVLPNPTPDQYQAIMESLGNRYSRKKIRTYFQNRRAQQRTKERRGIAVPGAPNLSSSPSVGVITPPAASPKTSSASPLTGLSLPRPPLAPSSVDISTSDQRTRRQQPQRKRAKKLNGESPTDASAAVPEESSAVLPLLPPIAIPPLLSQPLPPPPPPPPQPQHQPAPLINTGPVEMLTLHFPVQLPLAAPYFGEIDLRGVRYSFSLVQVGPSPAVVQQLPKFPILSFSCV